MVAHDVVQHGLGLLRRERRDFDLLHVAVDTDNRWLASTNVQVGPVLLKAESQELGDIHEPCVEDLASFVKPLLTSIYVETFESALNSRNLLIFVHFCINSCTPTLGFRSLRATGKGKLG